jgi:WXG100 family type VII secretion target
MPGAKIRADYDALKNAAQSFRQQSEAAAQSLQALKGQMDTLQGGDWIGQGANAFYAEMNDQVLPTLQRLRAALQTSADITQQISQQMKTAEDEAARVLRGDGSGAAGAAGAATGAGAGSATGAAGGGGAKAKVDPRLAPVQALIDKGDKDGAIAEAIKQYKIDVSTAKGRPKYNASTKGEGETAKDGTVDIGDKAFSSPGWLASSVGHEIVHTTQAADRWYTDAQGTHINEIEAYDWEIKHAPDNGLTAAEVAELNKRRTSHYNKLTDDNKKIIDGGSYKLPPPKAP